MEIKEKEVEVVKEAPSTHDHQHRHQPQHPERRSSLSDELWTTFTKLHTSDEPQILASNLQVVEDALTVEVERSLSFSSISQYVAETHQHIMTNIPEAQEGEEEDRRSSLRVRGSKGEHLELTDTGRLSQVSRGSSDVGGAAGGLAPVQGVGALMRFLEISSTAWYRELGGKDVLSSERAALWDHYSTLWLNQSARLQEETMASHHHGGVFSVTDFPFIAALTLGNSDAATKVYMQKKAQSLRKASERLFGVGERSELLSENVRILRSVRRCDLCQKVAFSELRADLPLLVGKAASLANPMDAWALTRVLDGAFLSAMREDVSKALLTVCRTDEGLGLEEDDLVLGLKVHLYDEEASMIDAPCLNEEILIMRWDDDELRSGKTRWWAASVIDTPLLQGSLTKRRTSVSMSHEGPLVQIKDTGERRYLRGSFYLRPNLVDTTSMLHDLRVGDRVLMKDDKTSSIYFEGVVFKIQAGNRYGVKMDGLDAARFTSRDKLLPGPSRIRSWAILSGMVRIVHDLPIKVHQIVLGYDPNGSGRKVSQNDIIGAATYRQGQTQRGVQSSQKLRTGHQTMRGSQQQSHRDSQPRSMSSSQGADGGGGGFSFLPPPLPTLLLDQTLGTEIGAAWVSPLADRMVDVQKHLLVNISRVLKGRLMGLGRNTVTAEFTAEKAIATVRPVFADLGHYLSLCIIGCHGLHGAVHGGGACGGGSYEQHHLKGGSNRELGSVVVMEGGGSNTTIMRDAGARTQLMDQLAKLRRTQSERRQPTPTNTTTSPGGGGTTTTTRRSGGHHQHGLDGSGGGGDEDSCGSQELDSSLNEAGRDFAAGFSGVLNGVYLELKHVVDVLRSAVCKIRSPSEMKQAAELLTLAAFLRNTWNHLTHRLELTMGRFNLDDNLATAFSTHIWRVTSMVDDMLHLSHTHLLTINVHWCHNYFHHDILSSDWQSHKPYMQDRRCTYGVLAWSLYLRGLVFDLRTCLYNPFSVSEARDLLTSVLARTLPPLVCTYMTITPSRSRLSQYTADLACLLVTALMLHDMLRSDSFASLLGPDSSGTASSSVGGIASMRAFHGLLPVANRPLESGLQPHDASHQSTLANLVLVERYCNHLLSMIALLRAPTHTVAWYIRLVSNTTTSTDHEDYAAAAAMSRSSRLTDGGVRENPPPMPPRVSSAGLYQEMAAVPDDPINDVLVNIDIKAFTEAFQASLELGGEVFNVVSESQKLGGSSGDEAEQEQGGGEDGGIATASASNSASTTRASATLFAEYSISRATLSGIELKWKQVLLRRQPMTRDQFMSFVKRRYELCGSPFPPLTEAEVAHQSVLQEAIGVYELMEDLKKQDARTSECLQS